MSAHHRVKWLLTISEMRSFFDRPRLQRRLAGSAGLFGHDVSYKASLHVKPRPCYRTAKSACQFFTAASEPRMRARESKSLSCRTRVRNWPRICGTALSSRSIAASCPADKGVGAGSIVLGEEIVWFQRQRQRRPVLGALCLAQPCQGYGAEGGCIGVFGTPLQLALDLFEAPPQAQRRPRDGVGGLSMLCANKIGHLMSSGPAAQARSKYSVASANLPCA